MHPPADGPRLLCATLTNARSGSGSRDRRCPTPNTRARRRPHSTSAVIRSIYRGDCGPKSTGVSRRGRYRPIDFQSTHRRRTATSRPAEKSNQWSAERPRRSQRCPTHNNGRRTRPSLPRRRPCARRRRSARCWGSKFLHGPRLPFCFPALCAADVSRPCITTMRAETEKLVSFHGGKGIRWQVDDPARVCGPQGS